MESLRLEEFCSQVNKAERRAKHSQVNRGLSSMYIPETMKSILHKRVIST